MALTPEILVPRLGDALVEKGLLTPEQLQDALDVQNKARKTGVSPLLGQLLVELGYIGQSNLDQVVTSQILKLQTALQQSNLTLEHRVQERTAELEKAYLKLSELSKLKGNFISNISHELRTPMTHLKGYIALLLEGDFGIMPSEQTEAVEILRKSSERLGRLIDDLILFSTAEMGSIQIHKVKTNIRNIADQVISENASIAEQKNIHLLLECDATLIEVFCDSDRIHWVINQLIDNALKYTLINGDVILRISGLKNAALITVTDTGIGINPSQFDEIFEPFHQLDGSTTRRQGGTGLGLTLAKKIVEAHGSKIKVTSLPGKGSRFEFSLDLTPVLD
jgi:signal transduction histidine kinase